MKKYHRKIRIDYRNYFVKFSDGSTTTFTRDNVLEKLDSNPNIIISGITGPSLNMVVFMEQKIKDLGIYNDINN
jgi:hypothetical protein